MERKKRKPIGVILLLIILLALFWYATRVTFKSDFTVEINGKAKVISLINQTGINTILNGEAELDTKTLGEHTVNVKIESFIWSNVKEARYTVVDTTAPNIPEGNGIYVKLGSNLDDLVSQLNITDNSNAKITLNLEGNYDLNMPGAYDVTLTAIDEFGNKILKDYRMIVEVKGKEVSSYFETSKGFFGYVIDGATYIDGILIVNKTYSIPGNYATDLTDDFYIAFNTMREDMKKEGLSLSNESGYRTESFQTYLYNNSVNKYGKALADEKTARPGYSEHQGGVAGDFNWVSQSFANTKEFAWLQENAYKYGFILRYPKDKRNETGYEYEPWHYRYVGKELAKKLYNGGEWVTVETYFGITSEYSN